MTLMLVHSPFLLYIHICLFCRYNVFQYVFLILAILTLIYYLAFVSSFHCLISNLSFKLRDFSVTSIYSKSSPLPSYCRVGKRKNQAEGFNFLLEPSNLPSRRFSLLTMNLYLISIFKEIGSTQSRQFQLLYIPSCVLNYVTVFNDLQVNVLY